jgi:protein-S-isoprenylcysteine O-methyltransferase Ste14
VWSQFPILPVISAAYRFTGIVLVAAGFSMAWAANIVLLKKGTSIKPFEIACVLAIGAPYKFSRNPVYLSMTFALFDMEVVLGSLSSFIFPVVFVVITDNFLFRMKKVTLKNYLGKNILTIKLG